MYEMYRVGIVKSFWKADKVVYIDTNALYTANCYMPIQRNITTDAKSSLLSLTIAYFTPNVTTECF